jgi:hypothetical protein
VSHEALPLTTPQSEGRGVTLWEGGGHLVSHCLKYRNFFDEHPPIKAVIHARSVSICTFVPVKQVKEYLS